MGGVMKGAAFRGVMAVERALGGVRARLPLGEIRDFVLLQHASAVGSIVHATPLVPALRAAVPGCRIVVVASGMAVEIFRGNPGVDVLIETVSPLRDVWAAAAGLRAGLARAGLGRGAASATITSTGNERTRVAAQAVLSGAGNRVGFTVAPGLYRVALEFDYGLSQIGNNLRIVEALGHGAAGRFEPEVFFGAADRAWARETLAEAGVGDDDVVAVMVTQTSVTQRKSWRAERFQAAAEFLRERYGARIFFVGTAAESAAIDELRAGLGFVTTSVAGTTSLMQLTALLSLCDVGLTLDTGTMHLGRAVGLPMVIVAPGWSPAVEWLPVGDARFRILKKLEMPVATPEYVIDEVEVAEVTEALADLLERYPAGLRRRG